MTHLVTVLIPTLLRPLVEDNSTVEIPLAAAAPVALVLDTLVEGRPVLARRIRDETGALRRYVNIYVDGEDVRRVDGLGTPVSPGSEVMIIQSVAGG